MVNTNQSGSGFGFSVTENKPGKTPLTSNDSSEEYFGAAQFVLAGCYVEVDGPRQVYLEAPGILPASLDGRRAIYRRLERPWINLAARNTVAENTTS